MKQITPEPSPEILVARLINHLSENGAAGEELRKLNEAELFARYGDQADYPNRVTKQFLEGNDRSREKIEEKIASLLGDAEDENNADLTDPLKIKEYLDRFVEGQENAKRTLSVALIDYLQHGIRSAVLFIGPSGTGKTYMIDILAKKAGIPVVKKSLANVTTEGFKGQNLSEGLEDLLGVEQGILFLDEFDKVANNGDFNGFGPQLQNELLAYFTGEKIRLANVQPKAPEQEEGPNRNNKRKKITKEPTNVVDLGKILVIAAGAFHGTKSSPSLYRIIQKRLGGNTCKLDETELLENVDDSDLIEYGLKTELVGRLQSRAALKPHSVEGLYRILKYSEDSPLDRIKTIFNEIGITLHFDEPALLLLAQYAYGGIGVRGIHKNLDQLTRDLSFERSKYVGRDIVFTRSNLEQKLRKQVNFEKRDNYEIDWFNISSIIGYLDLFVPEQKEAKIELAKAFHLYNLRANAESDLELPLANVLLVGPSGSGKTYMVNLLAKKAGLPIASTNTTGKVPEGYTGTPLAEVFEQFSKKQDKGIIYIDEADKVLLDPANPLNNEFIGFLENGEVRGRQTGNYLFILSGACQDIYKSRKLQGKSGEITKEDLVAYGVREEILGRVPILVNIVPPTLETTVKVLEGPDSVITKYANYFRIQGYTLEMEEGVTTSIAREALKSDLGYRQLKTVCSRVFGEYMVNLQQHVKDYIVKVSVQDVQRILGGSK